MAQDDNHMNALKKFCDSDDRCVFVFEGDGELQVNSRPPPPDKMGKKILAFTKNEADAGVELAEIGEKITMTELSSDAVRQIMALSKEVYFPMLTNPGNQKGWPEVIAKELTENLHRFLAQTFVTMGHMSGETLLPLPPDEVFTNMEKNQQDKDSVHVLESAVIDWTKQIRDILRLVVSLAMLVVSMSSTLAERRRVFDNCPAGMWAGVFDNCPAHMPHGKHCLRFPYLLELTSGRQEPENVLRGHSNPGPQAEMDFWADKSNNLDLIHEQLNGEKVRRVMKVLEVTKSTYFPAFNRLCKEVAQARMEVSCMSPGSCVQQRCPAQV